MRAKIWLKLANLFEWLWIGCVMRAARSTKYEDEGPNDDPPF
jgi:hypothetical protein